MKPNVELKNLKYAAFASEETSCFEATVYIDGKRFCMASNQGQGGCDSYDPLPPKGKGWSSGTEAGAAHKQLAHDIHAVGLRADPKAVDAATTKLEDPGQTTYSVFEDLVCDALYQALCRKDMRGAFRRKWLYKKGDGKLYECKKRPDDTVANMSEQLKAAIPGSVLLNGLPEPEALKIWMDYS